MIKYHTPHSPTFSIHLIGKIFQAVNGILSLPEEAAEEMEELMQTRGDIAQNVRKIDLAAAEAKAKEFLKARQPKALKGVVTSETMERTGIALAVEEQKTHALTNSENPVNTGNSPPPPVITEIREDPSHGADGKELTALERLRARAKTSS